MKKCYNLPMRLTWFVDSQESWRSVSIRSSAGIEDGVDEAEDVVKQVSLTEASSLMTKLDLSDVDIYSSYSRDEETMGRE